jgi:hypothetical protein
MCQVLGRGNHLAISSCNDTRRLIWRYGCPQTPERFLRLENCCVDAENLIFPQRVCADQGRVFIEQRVKLLQPRRTDNLQGPGFQFCALFRGRRCIRDGVTELLMTLLVKPVEIRRFRDTSRKNLRASSLAYDACELLKFLWGGYACGSLRGVFERPRILPSSGLS